MIQRARSLFKKAKGQVFPEVWPHPHSPPLTTEPVFVFVFTPPYSGSTALANMLNSAHGAMMLHPQGEGQWLVPGLCREDRWDSQMPIDWTSVQAVWRKRVRMVEELVGTVTAVIEKSPPNMVRADAYLEHFPNHQSITFIRNPYANCASILYRFHSPDEKSIDGRIKILRKLSESWIDKATWIKRHIESRDPIALTYEQFCDDLEGTLDRIAQRIPVLAGMQPDLEIKIKDYAPQKISNQNRRQIGKLTEPEIAAIGGYLEAHEELLNFFRYTSGWKTDLEQGGAGNVPLRQA